MHSRFYTLPWMSDDALTVIYKADVGGLSAKILHAIPAWWGFATASNRQT